MTKPKITLQAEVLLRPDSTASLDEIRVAAEKWLAGLSRVPCVSGPLPRPPGESPLLDAHAASLSLVEVEDALSGAPPRPLYAWEVVFEVRAFSLDTAGPEDGDDDGDGDGDAPSFRSWALPSSDFHGLWDSLHYDTGVKRRLLRYADSSLIFSQRGVSPHLVSCGRVALLHGPPGTGKTSLCKALAHKLAVRLLGSPNAPYRTAELVEVNAHSLFSRWFSESGKLVARLFETIREKLEEPDALVFVLVDEVESLAAARGGGGGGGGGEPSDAVRAVNALLTSLDQLKTYPNAMVLTTSNVTGAIDLAFIDRADIKAYIGPPTVKARYEMLRGSFEELVRAGIVAGGGGGGEGTLLRLPGYEEAQRAAVEGGEGRVEAVEQALGEMQVDGDGGEGGEKSDAGDVEALAAAVGLLHVAEGAEGLSGRSLRKLPFLAHAGGGFAGGAVSAAQFTAALAAALVEEKADRLAMVEG